MGRTLIDFDRLPDSLRASATQTWRDLEAAIGAPQAQAIAIAQGPTIARVFACSRFVADACLRDPQLLPDLVTSGRLTSETPDGAYRAAIVAAAPVDADEVTAMVGLRGFRRREMVRIAWREIAGAATVAETLRDLSALADAAVAHAVAIAQNALSVRHGQPRRRTGRVLEPVFLAMGKLGGSELNFSSDIDLVLLFPEAGFTDGNKPLDNAQYFSRLGQRVIRLLDEVTGDGFVFRVDMRLRPFGTIGALALSFDAFEAYLVEHGREWERYAYVKARALTGDASDIAAVRERIRPFVYRRYLDFGMFEALRDMKDMIRREVKRRELEHNIKLGSGGIREIEFIAQVFQLIRGGRDPVLRSRRLARVLPRLAERRHLSAAVVEELIDAYLYLRRIENLLQAIDDEQTHTLPTDPADRERLALAMNEAGWDALAAEIAAVRARVTDHFETVVFGPGTDDGDANDRALVAIWDGSAGDPCATLADAGYDDTDRALAALQRLRDGAQIRRLDERGIARINRLLPRLIAEAGKYANATDALERVCVIIDSVGLRSAYFALLNEHPAVLSRLVDLSARSLLVAHQVASDPLLLDELIDPVLFNQPPTREQFAADLAQRFEGLDDAERQREALSQFQRSAVFHVVVADLSGILPLMKVSDRLTDIAELALEKSIELGFAELEPRYGRPYCDKGVARREAGFAVVAYGKLGGLELGYGSDLDIVFVHDSQGRAQHSDGPRELDNARYFVRLAQRIVTMLTTQTGAGSMYEVDTRLRPSGKSGLMVSSLEAFVTYQRDEAWTWEHQALLRSRAVAGDAAVRAAYEALRIDVLTAPRDTDALRGKVLEMRARMRSDLQGGAGGRFHIKRDPGGITDIEFLVQYWVLRWAHRFPELVQYSDNIRQLEALSKAELVANDDTQALTRSYLAYRHRLHHLSLMGAGSSVPDEEFASERTTVTALWRDAFTAEP